MSAIRRRAIVVGAFLWQASSLLAQQYTISTIAGGGPPPTSVNAASVRLPISGAIVTGLAGEVYFTSENSVLKVDANGILTRVAGTGKYGYSGDGGAALDAQLAWPAGLALDGAGNLFIGDNANHRVRKVSPEGIISTVAGTGSAGYSGDDGAAANAQLNWPTGLAADSSGNLFIADTANGRIRKLSFDSGIITTVAAGLHLADGIALDASGNLYIADYSVVVDDEGDNIYTGRVLKKTTSGAAEAITPEGGRQALMSPRGVAVDATGNVYVADAVAGKVIKISSGGVITQAAGDLNGSTDCPAVYFNINSTQLVCPAGVAVDNSGNLYVSDTGHSRIAKISPQGDVANVVGDGYPGNYWGDGGKAGEAALYLPLGLLVDKAGNLYIADTGNSRVRKVSSDGIITTVAGNGTSGYSGDGGPATSAQLRGPAGLALDASGNLYIADHLDNRIRKVSADGIITTVAGRGDTNPPLGDGGPATSASLAGPFGVAVDASGSLYIADTFFYLIRKVSPEGIITTVAGRNFYQNGPNEVSFPTGLAGDAAGNLYIATTATIRKLSPDGTISTVAGNGATGIPPAMAGPRRALRCRDRLAWLWTSPVISTSPEALSPGFL